MSRLITGGDEGLAGNQRLVQPGAPRTVPSGAVLLFMALVMFTITLAVDGMRSAFLALVGYFSYAVADWYASRQREAQTWEMFRIQNRTINNLHRTTQEHNETFEIIYQMLHPTKEEPSGNRDVE